MSEKYIYSVDYRYTCEACGSTTDWQTHREYGVTAPGREPADAPAGAETAYWLEDDNIRERKATLRREFDGGNYARLAGGEHCPACAARQSWKPPYDFAGMTIRSRVALSAIAFFVLGMILGFVLCAILRFSDTGILALLVLTAACTLIGTACSLLINLAHRRKNRQFIAACKTHNRPEIDWVHERVRLVLSHNEPEPADAPQSKNAG